MKYLIKILLIIVFINLPGYSQSEDSSKPIISDTSKLFNQNNPLLELQIKYDEFELHRQLYNIKLSVPIDSDSNTVWLRTSLILANTDNRIQPFSPHFLSPLERKYYEDSKFDPIRYVLGAAQVGAVGYLAYKHIKKYGFLK